MGNYSFHGWLPHSRSLARVAMTASGGERVILWFRLQSRQGVVNEKVRRLALRTGSSSSRETNKMGIPGSRMAQRNAF
ncbi:hypothetical protein BgiBS90_016166 [Biomphalaria glabrata]|nr:hypothetical protein BgiBS90_016166 [Biomphalaria glabrata]